MKPMENKHTQYVDFSNPNADKITTGVTNKPMINKKQTAVEWLEQKFNDPYNNRPFITKEEFEQAKAMEKQQIMNAVYDSMGTNFDPNMGRAELYYNETFK
jgi:hypothetical protein